MIIFEPDTVDKHGNRICSRAPRDAQEPGTPVPTLYADSLILGFLSDGL